MRGKELGDVLEISLERIERLLSADYGISKRAIGLLLLQEDAGIASLVKEKDGAHYAEIEGIINEAKSHYAQPLRYIIAIARQEETNRISQLVTTTASAKLVPFKERLSRWMMNPVTGIPILLAVLYWGLFKFVGGFGAGVVVDFIEREIFEKNINPFAERLFSALIPWQALRELFVGEYGIITLGVRYAVALILPIVSTFFIAFSIIEDTGYLPRIALLIDRLFKKIGLTGRAVIPMVLGLGCDTMATMVTRTLPTKRERIIATILLALAIPCSAQLGVILSLLEGSPRGLWLWASTITAVFLFVGFVSSKIMPGEAPQFYMEVPPLRMPRLSNVLTKTYTRVRWYFVEVFPMFILASVLIWLGQLTGFFNLMIGLLKFPVRLIGLPDQTAVAFLFGFFRRDYGVGGLYDIKKAGLLSGNQLVIACVTLTLFLPCVAQFLMNIRERGARTGLGISLFILIFSFGVGFLLNLLLRITGIQI